jgi:hypothetical protein
MIDIYQTHRDNRKFRRKFHSINFRCKQSLFYVKMNKLQNEIIFIITYVFIFDSRYQTARIKTSVDVLAIELILTIVSSICGEVCSFDRDFQYRA